MNLTSLKEFYANKDKKNISLYRAYLGEVEKVIREAIDEAIKIFGPNDESVEEMQRQRSFIGTMTLIIDSSTKEVMNNSVSKLSDEELVGIISEATSKLEEERDKVLADMNAIVGRRDEINKYYLSMMELAGYKEEYYKAEDTAEFFKEILSSEDYVMELIKSDYDIEALKRIFAGYYSVEAVNEKLAEYIISIRKISKASDDVTVRKAIELFLTSEKIGKIVGLADDNECLKVFENMQKEARRKTNFFNSLTPSLQKDLYGIDYVNTEAYARLSAIYKEYLEKGKIEIPENADIHQFDGDIEGYQQRIAEFNEKIEHAKEAMENRETMEELVRSMINAITSDDGWSISKVSKSISEEKEKLMQKRELVNGLIDKRDFYEDKRKKLEAMLRGEYFINDMNVIKAREAVRKEARKQEYSVIAPVVEAEGRRFDQFRMLADAIFELSEIKEKIDRLDNSRNVFDKITGSNRKLKAELLEQYNKVINKYFEAMCEADIVTVQIVHKKKTSEDDMIQQPVDFDGLFYRGLEVLDKNICPRYQLSEEQYNDFLNRGVINKTFSRKAINERFSALNSLGVKLFKAWRREDGVYEFGITMDELNELLKLQDELVNIFNMAYESISEERKQTHATAKSGFSMEFMIFATDTDISVNSLTTDDLNTYKEFFDTKKIEVDGEIARINAELDNSEIYGEEPFNMLAGFDDTTISSDDVKKSVRL